MAHCCNTTSALIFLAFLLSAALDCPPAAEAAVPTISGQLCCTANGNCPGEPVPQTDVDLNCVGLNSMSTLTNANGNFVFSNGVGFDQPTTCLVTVVLPVSPTSGCAELSTGNGLLTATVNGDGLAVWSAL